MNNDLYYFFKESGPYHWFRLISGEVVLSAGYIFDEFKKEGFSACEKSFQPHSVLSMDAENEIITFVLSNPGSRVVVFSKSYGIERVTSVLTDNLGKNGYGISIIGNRWDYTVMGGDWLVVEKHPT